MTTHKSTAGSVPSRRALLLNGAAIAALLAFSPAMAAIRKETTRKKEAITKTATAQLDTGATAIRPFHIHIPEEALTDLRRRLAATRWPDKETVADQSQGVQLATMKKLVRYWQTDYDWRKAEAKLNALPQSITEIDGLDIHFIHVRSRPRMRSR